MKRQKKKKSQIANTILNEKNKFGGQELPDMYLPCPSMSLLSPCIYSGITKRIDKWNIDK